jgi:hypothetical protein
VVVHIQVLRRFHDLARVLQRDGWSIDEATPKTLEVTHREVDDRAAARARLHRLDLLTSRRLRIEFDPDYLPACRR